MYYGAYLGIEHDKQRIFSLICLRQFSIFQTSKGVIEFNIIRNRLTIYLEGHSPIDIAKIVFLKDATDKTTIK